MSYDEIRLVYELAEEMAQVFGEGMEQLQDTMQEMQSLANMLEEGALLGRGGAAYVDAIRNQLCPSLARFAEKFQELQGDVNAAISAMQEADKRSSSELRN